MYGHLKEIWGAEFVDNLFAKQDSRYSQRYKMKTHHVDLFEVAQELSRENPVAFIQSVTNPFNETTVLVHDSITTKFLCSDVEAHDVPTFWEAFSCAAEEQVDGTNVSHMVIDPSEEAQFRHDVKQIVSAQWNEDYPLEEVEVRVMSL